MFILTIDTNSKIIQSQIDRLVRIHETPQDPVIIEYSELAIPDGIVITKFDGTVEQYVKGQLKSSPKYLEHNDGVKKALHKQKERLSKEKFINL
jgi:hypothetical protein